MFVIYVLIYIADLISSVHQYSIHVLNENWYLEKVKIELEPWQDLTWYWAQLVCKPEERCWQTCNGNLSDWNTLVVGKLSPWIDVDCEDPTLRQQSELTLTQELQYCTHLGLPAVMLSLHGPNHVNLARLLHNRLYANCCFTAWVVVGSLSPIYYVA